MLTERCNFGIMDMLKTVYTAKTYCKIIEPPHDKTNNVITRPAKTQISLGFSFLHANSEDSDQTGRMPRLIWFFTGRTCHFDAAHMIGE